MKRCTESKLFNVSAVCDVICHLHSRQLPSDEELHGDVSFLFKQHRMI